jgi:hypothetical protein
LIIEIAVDFYDTVTGTKILAARLIEINIGLTCFEYACGHTIQGMSLCSTGYSLN